MTATKPRTAGRNARLAKVHIAVKDLGLDDATYRALLARLFNGKTSSKDLSEAQLDALLEHFKSLGFKPARSQPRRAGNRKMASGEVPRKLRALWLSLYHLGAVRDPREEALAAYVKRTTGVEALQWLDVQSGSNAVEGLKKMAERAGVEWGLHKREASGALEISACDSFDVVSAQWARLVALGAIRHPHTSVWRFAEPIVGAGAPHFYNQEDWHRLLELLGRMIRSAQEASS